MDLNMESMYEHYIESSNDSSDEEGYAGTTTMMQAFLPDVERAEHVLYFKG